VYQHIQVMDHDPKIWDRNFDNVYQHIQVRDHDPKIWDRDPGF